MSDMFEDVEVLEGVCGPGLRDAMLSVSRRRTARRITLDPDKDVGVVEYNFVRELEDLAIDFVDDNVGDIPDIMVIIISHSMIEEYFIDELEDKLEERGVEL